MTKNKKHKGKDKRNALKLKDMLRKVLKVFRQNQGQALNYKQIAAKLQIKDAKGRQEVILKIEELKAQKRIEEVDRGNYKLKAETFYIYGKVDMKANGSAYIISEETESDVYISRGNTQHAMHNDFVKVYLYRRRKRSSRQEGEIVEVIERSRTEFVGQIEISGRFAFVIPDSNKMPVDFFVPLDKINGAENNQKVIVRMTDWPEKAQNPFGEVIDVLGTPGDHDVEMHSILAEYGLPYKFPDAVEHEANQIDTSITEEEIAKRRDMRGVTTFTIDPVDAKDFDDALSVEKLENGNWEIGIHIADVSHYIKEGSLLEEEAVSRATSVYLVDRVVPMLPEILSNKVCSLRPNEEKLTFSAVFEINENAEVIEEWFGRTVTLSDRRFTYEEAQDVIENKEGDYKEEILLLDNIAKQLRKTRGDKGAISFDRVEVKFKLNEKSEPVGIYFKESKDSNHLIEEFMLLANRKVAEFVGTKINGEPSDKTFIYRIHDDPDPEKLSSLKTFVSQFGYKMNIEGRKAVSTSLNKLLADVHGKAEANMVETLAVRSMSKAKYTTGNIGHYGLAFNYYTHFTSPIRRYPDVMVHRLLQHYLDGGSPVAKEDWEVKAVHSSDREMMASKAERESIKYMQVKYMDEHRDQNFMGVISGVTEWGMYVEIIDNKCEGLVRIREIKDDFYTFDSKNYSLVGDVTKNIYQLGDQVMVKVKNTNLEKKQLDYELVE
ncbi:MAG: ribonuclease R [Ichthyobacteriaceae bacterium]|nr:ribonuclease R [Ichthyobacteriaceae bacterium]